MLFLMTAPNIVLLWEANTPKFMDTFMCMYCVQNIGSLCPVFCVCCRFYPSYFKSSPLICAFIAWVVGLIYGHLTSWKGNTWAVPLVLMGVSMIILTKMTVSWGKAFYLKLQKKTPESLLSLATQEEIYCLLFLFSTFCFLFFPLITIGVVALFRWGEFSASLLCVSY